MSHNCSRFDVFDVFDVFETLLSKTQGHPRSDPSITIVVVAVGVCTFGAIFFFCFRPSDRLSPSKEEVPVILILLGVDLIKATPQFSLPLSEPLARVTL